MRTRNVGFSVVFSLSDFISCEKEFARRHGWQAKRAKWAGGGPVRAEHGQPDGPVARRINGLGTVEAPDRLKPSARVGATARGAFGDAVVDPHTLLRKKGEWACWAPAYSLSVRWLAGLLEQQVCRSSVVIRNRKHCIVTFNSI